MQSCHQQSGGHPFSADIGDDEVDATIRPHHEVVVVAAHRPAGTIHSGERVAGHTGWSRRQEAALDHRRGLQLLVHDSFLNCFFAETRRLQLNRRESSDLCDEPHVFFGDLPADEIVDVQHADDRVADD